MNNKSKEIKPGSLCYIHDKNKNKYFYIYLGKTMRHGSLCTEFYSITSKKIWVFGSDPFNTSLGELHVV